MTALNTREALDMASEGIVAAMREREADAFAEIHVKIVKAHGQYQAIEVENKKRTNLKKG